MPRCSVRAKMTRASQITIFSFGPWRIVHKNPLRICLSVSQISFQHTTLKYQFISSVFKIVYLPKNRRIQLNGWFLKAYQTIRTLIWIWRLKVLDPIEHWPPPGISGLLRSFFLCNFIHSRPNRRHLLESICWDSLLAISLNKHHYQEDFFI